MRLVTSLASIGLFVTVAGCSSQPSAGDPPAAADDSAVYAQYVIQLHGDQPPTVVQNAVTARQQEAMKLTRETLLANHATGELQQAISQDLGCLSTSLWLYSQPNRSGHMACVSGVGTLQLSWLDGFGDRGVLWDGGVRSYWAGSEKGGFWGPPMEPGSLFCGSGFSAWQIANQVDGCTAAAHQVHLDD